MEDRLIRGKHAFISVTGGGGKTTFLISFGEWLRNKGKSVLLTTTTKLASPGDVDYRVDSFCSSIDEVKAEKGRSLLFAEVDDNSKKLIYPGREALIAVESAFDVVIAEADGSRGMPLKIHSKRDPVIEEETTAVVAVIGGWALGRMTDEMAFGDGRNVIIDREYLEDLLFSPEGACKGMRDDTQNIILFNGGDILSKEEKEILLSLSLPENVSACLVSERNGEAYCAL